MWNLKVHAMRGFASLVLPVVETPNRSCCFSRPFPNARDPSLPLVSLSPLFVMASSSSVPLLATASGASVKIWQSVSSSPLILSPTVSPVARRLASVAWNHTGAVVASGGLDGHVILHHTSGAIIGSVPEETSSTSLSSSSPPSGGALAAAQGGSLDAIYALCFSKGSRYVATAGASTDVLVWDLKKRVCAKVLVGHTAPVYAVAYSHGDTHVASAGSSGSILLHSQVSGVRVGELTPTGVPASSLPAVNALAFSPLEHGRLASVDDDGTVRIWDATSRTSVCEARRWHDGGATAVAFHPSDAGVLCTAGADKCVTFFDPSVKTATTKLSLPDAVLCCALSSDGNLVAAGLRGGSAIIYDVRRPNVSLCTLAAGSDAEPVVSIAWQARGASGAEVLSSPAPSSSEATRTTPLRTTTTTTTPAAPPSASTAVAAPASRAEAEAATTSTTPASSAFSSIVKAKKSLEEEMAEILAETTPAPPPPRSAPPAAAKTMSTPANVPPPRATPAPPPPPPPTIDMDAMRDVVSDAVREAVNDAVGDAVRDAVREVQLAQIRHQMEIMDVVETLRQEVRALSSSLHTSQ